MNAATQDKEIEGSHRISGNHPFSQRIGTRLFVSGAVLVLLTGLVVALVGATIARQGVLAEAERRVLALVEQRESHLRDWLEAYLDTARHIAESLVATHSAIDEDHLHVLQSLPGVLNISLLNGVQQVFPLLPESDWIPDSIAVYAAFLSQQPAYSALQLSSEHIPVFDVIIPLHLTSVSQDAILALQLDSRLVLDPILTDSSGLGERGELFLLDREMRMLTPSRFHSHPDPFDHIMDIPPARAALDQSSGSMQYESFLGVPVVGGYVYMPDTRWILVGELDAREALAPVTDIYNRTAIVLGLALLVLLIITLLLARSWAQPIVRLTRASEQVASGEYEIYVPLPKQNDEVHRLTGSFNRMTDALRTGKEQLALAQRRLVQQETMAAIGGLVSSIVHEIRNPLSSIKMNLRLLERSTTPKDKDAEHLALAQQESGRLETMLGELLDYSKPINPTFHSVSINYVVESVADSWVTRSDNKYASIDLQLEQPSPTVSTDDELLRRTLENLLQNAAESLEASGIIQLKTSTDEAGDVKIEISDSGKGMSQPTLDRIFDPFFTTRDDGTGLGMANVKRFVELIDGRIQVLSQEGTGTVVSIILPGGST